MSAPSQQSVSLTFQDPSGSPLVGGSVHFELSVDLSTALALGPQITAQRVVEVTLDDTGSCTVLLWPNNLLVPANSVYFVNAYTAEGQPAWSGQMTVTE
jgi:hypothetical protein